MEFKKVIIAISILLLNINCKKENNDKISTGATNEIVNKELIIEENQQEIAEKLKPKNSKITHEVIETEIWGRKKSIIAFYETKYIDSISTTEKFERQYVEGYLLIPSKNGYKKVLIDKFEDDNVATNIESVFFANVDKDNEKELIIIFSNHHNIQHIYEGTEYHIGAFDNFNTNYISNELASISIPIADGGYGGFEGYTDENHNSKAKFKTAADVKKALNKLGYK